MPATDPQSLITQAQAYDVYGPTQWPLIKLGLLKQTLLALNSMAATDPQSLITSAQSYDVYGPGFWPLIELGLLLQIAANGGGGGGGGTTYVAANYGGGQPSFTPSGGTGQATDTSNGRYWLYWSGAWH